ncbi:MAG: DUF2283 domain-containing protein [Chloroflexota bacterium]
MTSHQSEWLIEYEESLDETRIVNVSYDREGDILEIFFAEGAGSGIELTDEIVLRYNQATGTPLSLILLSFSHLVQPTEYGPESFRLSGLEKLSPERRETIMRILTSPPVNHYLRVSALTLPRSHRLVPITTVRPLLAVVT